MLRTYISYIGFLCLSFFIIACSAKKDNFKNRSYHKATAWFNTLYNGEEALRSGEKLLKAEAHEDYTATLPVRPWQIIAMKEDYSYEEQYVAPAKKKGVKDMFNAVMSRVPVSATQEAEKEGADDFGRAASKAVKGIEHHSMMIKGTERNKLIASAYLLLGKANYYQGKSFEALDAFNFAASNVKEPKEEVQNQIKLWTAKANLQAGNKVYALEELIKLYEGPGLKKETKSDVAALYSQILIDQGKYDLALEALDKAKKNTKEKQQKARLTYIQGQLLQQKGNLMESSKMFDQVEKYHPDFEMLFHSKMEIARNYDPSKNVYEAFMKQLEPMLKDRKYEDKKDAIYYNMGLISEKSQELEQAEKYYALALKENMSSENARALTFAHKGNLHFNQGDYLMAANYYDSASMLIKNEKILAFIASRKEAVGDLSENHQLRTEKDSLYRLARMDPAQQKNQVERYVEQLKKEDKQREKELREREEEVLRDSDSNNSSKDQAKNNFYFYNANIRTEGAKEFRSVWGDRPLKDNWRLAKSLGEKSFEENNRENQPETLSEEDKYDATYYLAQIPIDETAIMAIKEIRDSAAFEIGTIYNDKIKDYDQAVETFKNLITQYQPNDDLKVKAYYNLYDALTKQGKTQEAQQYKQSILDQYPNTVYAQYVLNPDAAARVVSENTDESISLYEETFKAYEGQDWKTYDKLSKTAETAYANQKIEAKFALLEAFSKGKRQGKEAMIGELEKVASSYPQSTEGKKAQELIVWIEQQEETQDRSNQEETLESKTLSPLEKLDTPTRPQEKSESPQQLQAPIENQIIETE